MRGSAAFRAAVAPGGVLAGPWVRNELWRRARAVPSLDLRFAENKSLGDAVTGQSLVTFTRASSGTYVGSDGLIKTASNDIPRFDHDPTTGESLGLLVEESRSNLLLNSATLATQNVTVTAVAHTLSFYGTGTVTLSGTHSATVAGTGAYPSRATLTFTPTAGTLTVTVSGTVEYANLETGDFPSSYIPTTTATVTRAADVASISGAAFSSWYRQDEGTVYFQGQTTASATNNIYAGFSTDGTFSNSLYFVKNTSNELRAAGMSTSLTLGNVLSNIMLKSAVGYISGTGSASGSLNGGTVDVDSSTSILSTMTSFVIGSAPWSPGNSSWNGTIRRLTYWPARLPNSTLQTITQ